MPGSLFDAIRKDGIDSQGRKILEIYANQVGRYAVYRSDERVVVCYAEDPLVEREQRRRLSTLAVRRSRIDGDLAEWRKADPKLSRLPRTAQGFDGTVGAALIEALEGNAEGAATILDQVQREIDGEKAARAKLAYLGWALLMSILTIAVSALGFLLLAGVHADTPGNPLAAILRGMIAGVMGAFYSIALGMKDRQLRDDKRRLDHVTDALVRVAIGALAAFILEVFLLSGAVQINFGDTKDIALGGTQVPANHWTVELIAGFLAGFAERMVPDLLNSYSVTARTAPALSTPPPSTLPADPPPAGGAGAGGPGRLGGPGPAGGTVANAAGTVADVDTPVAAAPGEDDDGCVIGHADDGNATDDEDLPPAAGGVAGN